jgi:hypothetical protein
MRIFQRGSHLAICERDRGRSKTQFVENRNPSDFLGFRTCCWLKQDTGR